MCDTTGVTSISLRNPDLSPISSKEDSNSHIHHHHHPSSKSSKHGNDTSSNATSDPRAKQNQVGSVMLCGVPIVSLVMDGKERLCLAQISSTLLKDFSYNEIHNRRVALGITCVQCTPVQLEILRRAGAMPVTSRRCGMITRREAERLCQSFLGDHAPPQLPENFAFEVYHECGWGSRGSFVPSRYNSSRAKCIRCTYCQLFFSPNKFIFHSHRLPESRYVQPDAANFNSWRRHLKLCGDPPEDDSNSSLSMDTAQIVHAWEDVRAMFNGGTRKRMLAAHCSPSSRHHNQHNSAGRQSHGHDGESPSRGGGEREGGSGNPGRVRGSKQASSGSGQHGGKQSTPQSPPSSRHSSSHHGHLTQAIPAHNFSPNTAPLSGSQHSLPSPSSPNTSIISSSATNLLSPSNRLENIWNPGVASVNVNPGRLGGLGGTQIPHLPFHPLSFPWLRRPIFPFTHPFSPAACHLLADAGIVMQEKLVAANLSGRSGSNANPTANQSAFKPVSRSHAENFFSWLNNNNSITSFNGSCPTLPEDLSLSTHPQSQPPLSTTLLTDRDRSPVSTTNDDYIPNQLPVKGGRIQGPMKKLGNRHQIQILSNAPANDSDDEENVDIESTEVEEECSSTSFIWVTSSNNNNNTENRKRKSVDSHSNSDSYYGEDEKAGESSPSQKRSKRFWDFDTSEPVKKQEIGGMNCYDERTGFDMPKD